MALIKIEKRKYKNRSKGVNIEFIDLNLNLRFKSKGEVEIKISKFLNKGVVFILLKNFFLFGLYLPSRPFN